MSTTHPVDTQGGDYTDRLKRRGGVWWKRILNVQAPYRWNIRRLAPGFVLDVGCGIGRNLAHLDGRGVGVDHNAHSVEAARSRGLIAFTPEGFAASEYNVPNRFDVLLLAHVLEHVPYETAVELMRAYLPLIRTNGRVILICPQEAGYRSDPTHVRFVGFKELAGIGAAVGLREEAAFSFPFARIAGRFFRHNEFVCVLRKVK